MSTNALRCLGFAYKDELPEFSTYDGDEDHPDNDILLEPNNYSSIESKPTFVGKVGLRDPHREEVHQAIRVWTVKKREFVLWLSQEITRIQRRLYICREIGVFGPEEDIRMES